MPETATHEAQDDSLRGKAQHAFETSRDSAREAARQAASEFDAHPLGLLAGGLAVGVLAGALIPRSQKERELLAPVGKRIAATAVAALAAAKESGMAELDARGLTIDGAKAQVKTLLEGFGQAASTAGNAAVESARAKSA